MGATGWLNDPECFLTAAQQLWGPEHTVYWATEDTEDTQCKRVCTSATPKRMQGEATSLGLGRSGRLIRI